MTRDHAGAIVEMRAILHERGTVSNRDFKMATRTRTQSYRGRKDSALALYYLWRTGEVMTHHRENFERVYALTETVAPAHLIRESDEAEADRFLIKKEVSFSGLSRLNRVGDSLFRDVPFGKAKQIREALLADGEIIEVQVEGWKALHCALGSDAGLLRDVSAGRVPTPARHSAQPRRHPRRQHRITYIPPYLPVGEGAAPPSVMSSDVLTTLSLKGGSG